MQVKFKVAGHILGSAIVEVFVNEDGKTTKLVFTGDIGQPNQPIIEDPEEISGADFIITESTYGNRVHKAYDKEAELSEIINDTVAKGGNVVIPAFAVGRTQVLLYYFQKLLQEGRILRYQSLSTVRWRAKLLLSRLLILRNMTKKRGLCMKCTVTGF